MFLKSNNKFIILLLPFIPFLVDCSQDATVLPEKLYGCKLTKLLSGEEAKTKVNKLHFQNVASRNNKIGFYEGEDGPITIYVASYKTSTQARDDYFKMTRKISPENSVFIAGEYLKIGERDVYRCFGMGQTHLVLVHRKNLIWLSVDTIRALKILDAYLEYLN